MIANNNNNTSYVTTHVSTSMTNNNNNNNLVLLSTLFILLMCDAQVNIILYQRLGADSNNKTSSRLRVDVITYILCT